MSQPDEKKIKELTLILRDFLKVIKVVSLYPENNPLPTSLRRSFSEKLEWLVEDHGELAFSIKEQSIYHEGEFVYSSDNKNDNLAVLLFNAGITEFVFLPGLEVDEIYKLLDTFKLYINNPEKSQDVVSLVWESGITRVRFRTLEDIALNQYDESFDINIFIRQEAENDGQGKDSYLDDSNGYQAIFLDATDSGKLKQPESDQPLPPGATPNGPAGVSLGGSVFYASVPGQQPLGSTPDDEIDEISLRTAEAAEAMGLGDMQPSGGERVPDTALILNDEFKLSAEEEEEIRQIIIEDAHFEPYESTVELLQEMLLQETEMNGFFETVTICEKIINEFISAGKLAEASQILKYLRKLGRKLKKEKPLWNERINDALITCGSRERLQNVSNALNSNPDIDTVEINMYLENFDWQSLGGISDLIGTIDNDQYQNCIMEYLVEHGKEHIDVLSKGIYDKRTEVVINSTRILARIGNNKALHYLKKLTTHASDEVRLALVISLKDSPDDRVLSILQDAVLDRTREVRRQAVESIVARRGEKAFHAIAGIINDDRFGILDEDDQSNLLQAYSQLGGEHAVSYLESIIRMKSLFRDSQLLMLKTAAFNALAINKSEKCERVLLKLARSWRPFIKNQARETLKRRRDYIYGEAR